MILLATCERALEAFQAADNPVDREFVADLERIVARTRTEIASINEGQAGSRDRGESLRSA